MDADKQRPRGAGRIFRRHNKLWIAYCINGKERRESAHTDDYEKAEDLLNRRIFQLQDGKLPAPSRQRQASVNGLLDALRNHYVAHTRSARTFQATVKPLREFMGERRANSITTADIDAYIIAMRKQGYGEETIGGQLRRLMQAYRAQDVISIPRFPKMPHGQARDVLIEPADQQRLIEAFDDECFADMAEFYFVTGWRGKEIRGLQWGHIRGQSIRLVAENSKTGAARDYPLVGKVAEIIARRAVKRSLVTPHVFHRHNKPVAYDTWIKHWHIAVNKVGLAGLKPVPHDSRHAFATEAVDAGIDPQVVMALGGWKTSSMLNCYRIVTASTLARAIVQREQHVTDQAVGKDNLVVLAERRLSEKSVRKGPRGLRKSNVQ
jgi:integrase